MKTGGQYSSVRSKACAPPCWTEPARPCTRCSRSARVGESSVVRIWSSWTGVAVCASGITPPAGRSGDSGEPGFRSTKKLPSRKMRGRILSVASRWIGRPSESIASLISAVLPGPRMKPATWPTFTPAMRTGVRECSSFAERTCAQIVYGWFSSGSPPANAT